MSLNLKDDFATDLLACPNCKLNLALQEDILICKKCNSAFGISDGIYRMISDRLNDYDYEQQRIFDQVCIGYDKYLNCQPFYTLIRDRYVLPFWLKDDFNQKLVLDIGCGTGWASSRFVSNVSTLINLDISLESLKFAKYRLGTEKSIYVQSNMKKLPFLEKKFDIVICFWALHHLKNPEITIAEIGRVMNNNGIFLGIEPNIRFSWVEFWNQLLHLPRPLRKQINRLHKALQVYAYKQLEKEQFYMKNIQCKYDLHLGAKGIDEYKDIFTDLSFQFSFKPVGLEIVPPRLFMSKNRLLVELLLKFSDWCIAKFKKKEQAYFNIIRARKL